MSQERTSGIVKPLFRRWSRIYDLPIFQAYYGRVHDRILTLTEPLLERVLDVGCGTGELLAKLSERYPAAQLTGLPGVLIMASLGNGLWRHVPGRLGDERRLGGVVHRSPRVQIKALEDVGFLLRRVEPLLPAGWLYAAERTRLA